MMEEDEKLKSIAGWYLEIFLTLPKYISPTEKETLRASFWSSTRFLSSNTAIDTSLGCTSTTNSLITYKKRFK